MSREIWLPGKIPTVVVSNVLPDDAIKGSDDVEHYGGFLIAESVAPSMVPLISATIRMWEALENLENDSKTIPAHAWHLVQVAIAQARGHQPRNLCKQHKYAQMVDYDEDHDANEVEPGDCVLCEKAFERATGAA